MKTFNVISTHGIIVCDRETGKVLEIEPERDPESKQFLESIFSFDVDEWRKEYSDEELHGTIDILDLGYTGKDGTYEPPEHEWRADRKTEQEENKTQG
jgi:hypothetical protein